jgi:hypothetical protein
MGLIQSATPVKFSGALTKNITLTGVLSTSKLVITIDHIDFGSTGPTFTVNDGTAYTAGAQVTRSARNYAGIWYLDAPSAGSHTVAVTASSGTGANSFGYIELAEWSGLQSGIDQSGTNSAAANTTPSVTASGANTVSTDVVVAVFGGDSSSWAGVTNPPNTGYTDLVSDTTNAELPSIHAYKILSAIETSAANIGTLTTGSNYAAALVTFLGTATIYQPFSSTQFFVTETVVQS